MANSNLKIDPKLSMSLKLNDKQRAIDNELNSGYDVTQKKWRLIIKYNGDIKSICNKYHADLQILSDTFAIINILEINIHIFSLEVEVEYIEKPRKLTYILEKAIRETCIAQSELYYDLNGEGVLVGVIDSGIDYLHPDFIDANNETRIKYIYDLSIDDKPPVNYIYGHEYNAANINEAIKAGAFEESLKIVPHQDYLGHGTHISGIIAGNGRASKGNIVGCAPKAELIVVKLGNPDYEGYPINTIDIMLALKYIIDKAIELNRPIAINISYGSTIGSHDGNSVFETYISAMALKWKTAISIGMGNEGQKNHHTSGSLNNSSEIEFVICDSQNSLFLDIWINSIYLFDIEIVNNNNVSSGLINFSNHEFRYEIDGEQMFIIFNDPSPFNTKGNISISLMNEDGTLKEGIWKIRFRLYAKLTISYDIWMSGENINNNCKFLNPTLDNTLTIPATVKNVISVGGYNYLTGNIAVFSSHGSDQIYNIKPDLIAPSEGILSTIPNGGYGVMSGTSIATPFVSGAAALLLQWGIIKGNDSNLYGEKLKAYLQLGTKKNSNITYPNNVYGYGKLCLLNTLDWVVMRNGKY